MAFRYEVTVSGVDYTPAGVSDAFALDALANTLRYYWPHAEISVSVVGE